MSFIGAVQIAGVASADEASMQEDVGVDLIGFPLRLGYHTPDTTEAEARDIISNLKAPDRAVLIAYLTEASEIEGLARYLGVSTVQLHADISREELIQLREKAPSLSVIKSLIVRPECSNPDHPLYANAQEVEPLVDAFITDTFDPKTGAMGATGIPHDWSVSARVARLVSKPLILAGGLNPSNVYEAIVRVRPAAVDAHTGVEEASGAKSRSLTARFLSEARRAFAHLGIKDPGERA